MDTIKVWPLTEAGFALRHPHSHITFQPAESGMAVDGIDWPNDQFTTRRIADGDVTDNGPAQSSAGPKIHGEPQVGLTDEEISAQPLLGTVDPAEAPVAGVSDKPAPRSKTNHRSVD